jgi:hypothetical protein
MADTSVTRQLDLQSPPVTLKASASGSCEASGSAESSGSKKRRVVVDLDDIDSEPEDEAGKYDQKLVQVKIEPED